VHIYGGVAVSTFERIGTVKEVGGVPRASPLAGKSSVAIPPGTLNSILKQAGLKK